VPSRQIRTLAGPSRAVQCFAIGGPYTASSHVRQVHVVCPASVARVPFRSARIRRVILTNAGRSPVSEQQQRPKSARRVGTMTRAIHKWRIVRDDRDFDHIQDPNA